MVVGPAITDANGRITAPVGLFRGGHGAYASLSQMNIKGLNDSFG